ncbi:YesL family protein [Gracilibacillus sp. YIM 98692]|uniref:YesL family protein n=1 Tax=Gracilibacillus sp. YIM 98692 TaxID=2663532 RepID=UPI0013D0AB53|nr:YesL family protein [Gracilibacillus sp. YIM 98692]
MSFWEGKTMNVLRKITNIVLLNILWLISALPIVTAGVATLSMYGVIRNWFWYDDPSVVRNFFRQFKRHFKQGMTTVLCWFMIGALLIWDFIYFLSIPSSVKIIFISLTSFAFVLYLMVSAYLFIMMVHHHVSGMKAIKKAFIYAFLNVKTTIAIILMYSVLALLFFFSVFIMLMAVVPIIMITYKFALLSFQNHLEKEEQLLLPFSK